MNTQTSYKKIQEWAKSLRLDIKDSEDPAERVKELARVIAELRLKQLDQPSEPDFESVKTLLMEYLEFLVADAAQKKVASSENQPYFGCHRTGDSHPPKPS